MNQTHWSGASILSLLAALMVFTILWLFYPQEFIASDPWGYSWRAFSISESGDFGIGQVFDHRLTVLLPTALFYKIFGVSIQATNLLPLLSSLLIILTVWLALPDRNSRIIGTVLCLTSVPLFRSSVALYPDIISAAFMALSFHMLLSGRKAGRRERGWIAMCFSLIATASLFTAFLAKLSAYWVLPLWIWALAVDLKSKDRAVLLRRFYLPALIGGLCLGIGYLLFCTFIWDDPLARLKAIETLAGKHLWAWNNASAHDMMERLTISPVRLLISQYGIPVLGLSLLAPIVAPRSIRPWAYYAVVCLLLFWFGSTSFTKYEPMPLMERMTLPILPSFCILAAYLTSRLSVSSDRPAWVSSLISILFILVLTGIPFAKYLNSWRQKQLPEAQTMSIVRKEVEKHPAKQFLMLCSDTRSPRSLSFYFGYRYPENLHVVSVRELKQDSHQNDRVFVFMDRDRSRFLQDAYGKRHYDSEIDALDLPCLYTSEKVVLLEIQQQKHLAELIFMVSQTKPEPSESK
jgi:hypothetical protein